MPVYPTIVALRRRLSRYKTTQISVPIQESTHVFLKGNEHKHLYVYPNRNLHQKSIVKRLRVRARSPEEKEGKKRKEDLRYSAVFRDLL
jgi:hypothetical protein